MNRPLNVLNVWRANSNRPNVGAQLGRGACSSRHIKSVIDKPDQHTEGDNKYPAVRQEPLVCIFCSGSALWSHFMYSQILIKTQFHFTNIIHIQPISVHTHTTTLTISHPSMKTDRMFTRVCHAEPIRGFDQHAIIPTMQTDEREKKRSCEKRKKICKLIEKLPIAHAHKTPTTHNYADLPRNEMKKKMKIINTERAHARSHTRT